jgi:hypothetical protein
VDVEEFRNLNLSLASSVHHGDRLLLSSGRKLGLSATLAAGGPGTRQAELSPWLRQSVKMSM